MLLIVRVFMYTSGPNFYPCAVKITFKGILNVKTFNLYTEELAQDEFCRFVTVAKSNATAE